MAHKTMIGGTTYDITGGKCLIGGTGYNVKKGRTLIAGTIYDIVFSSPAIITTSGVPSGSNARFAYVKINGETVTANKTASYEPVNGEVLLEVYVSAFNSSNDDWPFVRLNGEYVKDGAGSYTVDVSGKTVTVSIIYAGSYYYADITTD